MVTDELTLKEKQLLEEHNIYITSNKIQIEPHILYA